MHGTVTPARPKRSAKAFWLKQFHTWHWMSSAICLVGMLLFAITGITLNHASSIEGSPVVTTEERVMPPEVLAALAEVPPAAEAGTPVPKEVASWLDDELGISAQGRATEWSEAELYVPLPRPGGDGWVQIDRATGDVLFEDTDRGWIAYFNDLHKGRDTSTAWIWFIDVFAAACIVFCVTGFLLLQIHSHRRPSTWPIVGAGVAIPLLLLIFLMH